MGTRSSVSGVRRTNIVIYVAGLSQDYNFFKEHMIEVEKNNSNVVIFETPFDMRNFNVDRSDFMYIDSSSNSKNYIYSEEFISILKNLVSFAKNNEQKSILVGTKLDFRRVSFNDNEDDFEHYDNVQNQSSKLCYLIECIKNTLPNVNIVLVGHSQGGLVNILTASRLPGKIYKLISVATPYSEVLIAEAFISLNYLASLVGKNLASIAGKTDDFDNYVARAKDLSSEKFFQDLYKKWNSLESKPPLYVVVGISGRIIGSLLGSANAIISAIKDTKFDGLVSLKEQTGIDASYFYYLFENNGDCLVNVSNNLVSCISKEGADKLHLCESKLHKVFIDSIIVSAINTFLKNKLNTSISDKIFTLDEFVEAVKKGIGSDENATNNDLLNDIFKIYFSEYSHGKIINGQRCIKIIKALISN